MNKLFSKIATLSVGLAMAVGVGVALGQRGVQKIEAVDSNTEFVTNATNLGYTSGTMSDLSMESDGVTITFSGITGKVNSPAKVQLPKDGTITSTAFAGTIKNVTVNGYSHTSNNNDGSFSIKGSTNGTAFTEVEAYTGLSKSAGTISTDFNESDGYKYFQILNGSDRVFQVSSIVVTFDNPSAKTVVNVVSVASAPSEVYVGGTISPSDVTLNVKYDDNSDGTVTATSVDCDTSAPGNVTATATYNLATGTKTAQFDVLVKAVEIESIEESSAFKTTFAENEVFSFGGGKIKVNYNNSTTKTVDPTAEGVTAMLGDVDVTGKTYYMQKADKDKKVTISYAGKSFQYTIAAVNDAPVATGYYSKVTSAEGLALGSKYIVVNEAASKAISTTQNDNNRGSISVTIDTTNNKIDAISANVEVFTLVEGTVTTIESAPATTYGLKTTDDKYLYAASSSKNYLRTSGTLNDNASWTITFSSNNAVITARGSNTRNLLRYNSSDSIFSCYASGQQVTQLYKFVSQEKTDDEKAVDTFVSTYMHLNDVNINDHSDSGACKGESGYYALAKAAYLALTADQKVIFNTSAEFNVLRAKERLAAWAVANGETFDPAAGTFETSVLYTPVMNFENNAGYVIIIAVITLSAISLGVVVLTHKRKHQ